MIVNKGVPGSGGYLILGGLLPRGAWFGGVYSRGVSTPGRSAPWGSAPGGMPGRDPPGRPLLWAVRILLECILVTFYLRFILSQDYLQYAGLSEPEGPNQMPCVLCETM